MANEVRKGIITGTHAAKAGHPGGSLSAAEVFTYLYFEEMNIDPAVASGPFITTINDLVAVISYYGLAWILLINVLKFV